MKFRFGCQVLLAVLNFTQLRDNGPTDYAERRTSNDRSTTLFLIQLLIGTQWLVLRVFVANCNQGSRDSYANKPFSQVLRFAILFDLRNILIDCRSFQWKIQVRTETA